VWQGTFFFWFFAAPENFFFHSRTLARGDNPIVETPPCKATGPPQKNLIVFFLGGPSAGVALHSLYLLCYFSPSLFPSPCTSHSDKCHPPSPFFFGTSGYASLCILPPLSLIPLFTLFFRLYLNLPFPDLGELPGFLFFCAMKIFGRRSWETRCGLGSLL